MTGPKTNERPGTRATAKYVRCSAFKARVVLDLIRGRSCHEAGAILELCERGPALPISKVLFSAMANAEHNDGLDADELYVSACYADEGATMKRFRPRARGRATRIRKRTCHITVIVSRYDAEELDRRRARGALSPTSAAASADRRRRVARSRGEADPVATDAEADTEITDVAAPAESDGPADDAAPEQLDDVAGDGAEAVESTDESADAAEEPAEAVDADQPADAEEADTEATDAEAADTEADESTTDDADAAAGEEAEPTGKARKDD